MSLGAVLIAFVVISALPVDVVVFTAVNDEIAADGCPTTDANGEFAPPAMSG